MRTARSALFALLLVTGACGSDPETSNDGGRDGGAGSGGRGGASGGRGGTNATAGRGGAGGGTAGAAGGAAGAAGGAAGAAGGTAGVGATGGAAGAAGAAGGAAGAAGGAAGAAGGAAGAAGGAAGAAGGVAGAAGGAAGAAGGAAGAAGGIAGAAGGAAGAAGGAAGAAGGAAGAAGGAAGAAGGAAGAAGGAGTGGGAGGGGTTCTTAATCPGVDDDCQQRVCLAGHCTTAFTAANTALAVQAPGDCKRAVCDGVGGVLPQILDSDTPADDTNVCTGEICTNGIPSHPALQAGTVCTQSGGRLCNGSSAAPACVGCLAVANCPGTDTLCQQRACQDNACVTVNAPAGTAAEADAAGNCHKNVCGSTGNVVSQIDNTDTPAEDGNTCTLATCNAGTPAQVPVATGTVCAQNNGRVCNGTAACVECITAANCPGTDTICRQRTCAANNTCGTVNAAAGIDAEADATGNCHKAVCDGNGGVASQIDDNDKPAADTNECTTATCTAGVPSQAPVTPGTICTQSGGKVCSGTACVECIVASDCAGTDSACQHRTCDVNHTCGTAFANAGDPAEADTAGNCHRAVCDGNGGVDSLVDDSDKPVDGNVCTNDVCTAGVATNPALPAGTICNADNVHVCNAGATCNPLTFRAVRVGDGSAALSSTSTATFVEERRIDGSLVGTALALPTAASGSNVPLTLSGSATSDGALALSANGRYLTLAGYAVAPGTGSVIGMSAATINRVVARIDVAGSIDTTTRFNTAFSADNVRSAASADGSGFWIGGNGTSTTGGVWYNAMGNVGGEVRIYAGAPNNTRWVQVFGNQLYVTGNSSTFVTVNTIVNTVAGTGLPTTTGGTIATLPGLTSGGSPFGYVLLDVNTSVAGLDTLYIADDGATAGIKKFTSNGTTWSPAGTLNTPTPTGFRGLAGYAVSGTVTLIASTNATTNELVTFVDTGSSVTSASVKTADTNTAYRGVALSPHFQP